MAKPEHFCNVPAHQSAALKRKAEWNEAFGNLALTAIIIAIIAFAFWVWSA